MPDAIYWIIGFSALAILVVVALFVRKRRKGESRGRDGERRVARVLARAARRCGGRVLNGVHLPLYEQSTEFDHILVGPFGVLVVETKNLGGEIFGDGNQQEWTQVTKTAKRSFYSPLLQNKTHVDNLRHHFQKERLYKVTIESAVVFADPGVTLNVPRSLPVYTLKALAKRLTRDAYLADKGVNVEQVVATISRNALTGIGTKTKHRKFVNEQSKH